MSPYDIPASVVRPFVSVRLWNCMERLEPKTVDDIICLGVRQMLMQRNVGILTLEEYRELLHCLIHDIHHFVQTADEQSLIDIREIEADTSGMVSAAYRLVDPVHGPELYSMVCHAMDMRGVGTLQDVLFTTRRWHALMTLQKQPETVPFKRIILEPVQEQVLKAREEGQTRDEEPIANGVRLEMLRSAILIGSVPLQPSPELQAELARMHIWTLYDLQEFCRTLPLWPYRPQLPLVAETRQECADYLRAVNAWLEEGRWTSLRFFAK